ncbi:MAG: NAD-dependent epimerase/dehydratase family protein [Bacteroidales bacterium]|nr:NAD-dependent epimerase/dehydratase family protein [Bacteroidales bacterium]
MIKVGITGESGFIGTHLYNTLRLYKDEFEVVSFKDEFFNDDQQLTRFVTSCDTIVHLAAMNRHGVPQVIYDTNITLVKKLIVALDQAQSKAHVLFSSSIQEDIDNLYGKSKKAGRELLANWAENNGSLFTGFVFPNIFGPFGNPYFNSFIATFSHQLTHGENPEIEIDKKVPLLYVAETVKTITDAILKKKNVREYRISHSTERKVTDILELLKSFQSTYVEKGIIPVFNNTFEINLFNTFRCYMDIRNHYPVKYLQHIDNRGDFVEIIRHNGGGQVSFSTTKPGIIRGNHFHTWKIERFSVIKGKALIRLRRIGTNEVLDFYLSGEEPAYVDIPIWYTHNITNIGEDELYTIFWINEHFDANNPDTFFENV